MITEFYYKLILTHWYLKKLHVVYWILLYITVWSLKFKRLLVIHSNLKKVTLCSLNFVINNTDVNNMNDWMMDNFV